MLKEPGIRLHQDNECSLFGVFLTNIYYWKRIDVAAERKRRKRQKTQTLFVVPISRRDEKMLHTKRDRDIRLCARTWKSK